MWQLLGYGETLVGHLLMPTPLAMRSGSMDQWIIESEVHKAHLAMRICGHADTQAAVERDFLFRLPIADPEFRANVLLLL